VRGQVRGKEVKDDIEGPVRVEVKIPDETDDAFPYRLYALRKDGRWVQRKASGR
jgi:hypothetical protein